MAVSADALIGAVVAWGLACLAPRDPAAVVGGAGRAAAGLRRADVLRHAAHRAGRAGGAGGGPVVAAAAGRRRRPRWPWCWRSPPRASRGGTPTRSCASATTTASRATGPQSYWWYGDLAGLVVSGGPAAAGGARSPAPWPAPGSSPSSPAPPSSCVAVADASGMSKAEVERIWLPFVPVADPVARRAAGALAPLGARRPGGRRAAGPAPLLHVLVTRPTVAEVRRRPAPQPSTVAEVRRRPAPEPRSQVTRRWDSTTRAPRLRRLRGSAVDGLAPQPP